MRLGCVYCVVTLVLVWSLFGVALVDWLFDMDRPQRLVAVGLAAVVVGYVVRRYALPFLRRRDRLVDLALLAESRRGVDSDFVAALQFETDAAREWGSPELRSAVVERAARRWGAGEVDLRDSIDRGPLYRRSGWLLVTVAVLGGFCAAFPLHAKTFFTRLALREARYPTATRIVRVVVNGGDAVRTVASDSDFDDGTLARLLAGGALEIAVHCAGELPLSGRAELTRIGGDERARIELRPAEADPTIYRGGLERLAESVTCRVLVGDARTDAARIEVVPRPLVDLKLIPVLPEYARHTGDAGDDDAPARSAADGVAARGSALGARQASVFEGSAVGVRIECANKALAEARLVVAGDEYPLRAVDSARRIFALDPTGTPFADVREPLQYEVRVTDEHGFEPSAPLRGHVRIRADRRPRVAAAVVHSHVLPTARPRIRFGALDDFALASVVLHMEVDRAGGRGGGGGGRDETETSGHERVLADLAAVAPRPRSVRDSHAIDLESLQLAKGDEVRLTVTAEDFRGDRPGATATSETIVLEVTDQRGLLAAMLESDQRSALQLDAIIERQLGIGESK